MLFYSLNHYTLLTVYAIYCLYRSFFESFCFPNTTMYVLNKVSATKKITAEELKDFIFKNSYQRIGFAKENCYYFMKHWNKKIYNCLQQN